MLHVCLRNRFMGWGARKSLSKQTGEPCICELIRRARQLRAEGTTTVDEVSPPGAANGIAERAILTVGGLVRATKAVVEENVLEGRSSGLRQHGWGRRATKGAQVRHTVGRFR